MATLSKTEKRRERARKHARRSWTCPCGRVCRGNGGASSHQRACPVYDKPRRDAERDARWRDLQRIIDDKQRS